MAEEIEKKKPRTPRLSPDAVRYGVANSPPRNHAVPFRCHFCRVNGQDICPSCRGCESCCRCEREYDDESVGKMDEWEE